MRQTIEYSGTCYIGVVGPTLDVGDARDSIERITRRAGDGQPVYIRATKGYEARQLHFANWLQNTSHAFMLLLDHDMIFSPDTLERLRSHKQPYVSGLYMRRQHQPIAPVWFELGRRGQFPMKPWTSNPERGRLHPLGASGWGCILIHRDVCRAVANVLKGEPFVIEDDLDVYPYDLGNVMGAISGLRALVNEQPGGSTLWPALREHVATLEREIRPLRWVKDMVGSDIRFPFYAREAGFILQGDPDVRPAHVLDYPLSPDDYDGLPPEYQNEVRDQILENWRSETKRLAAARRKVTQ